MTVPQTFLDFDDLGHFEGYWSGVLNWDLSDAFFMTTLGLWSLERKAIEIKCFSYCNSVDANLDHLAEVVFAGFPMYKSNPFFSPFHTIFF